MKEGEIIVLQTDKTGKFGVVDRQTYLQMGEEHLKGAKITNWDKVRETERLFNGHSAAWIKIGGIGDSHKHTSRVRENVINHSEILTQLYLLLKNHKPTDPGKPPIPAQSSAVGTVLVSNSTT